MIRDVSLGSRGWRAEAWEGGAGGLPNNNSSSRHFSRNPQHVEDNSSPEKHGLASAGSPGQILPVD